MSVSDRLKAAKVPPKRAPLWKGPEVDGITVGLLGRFLVCRRRFEALVVGGLKPKDSFNHRIEFGNMWHLCEETYAKNSEKDMWAWDLKLYVEGLAKKYPLDREEIDHWYGLVRTMFPIYLEHWSTHEDTKSRTPLLQEQIFDQRYKLPNGKTIRLRGKWDGVDLLGEKEERGLWTNDHKTKSKIEVDLISRQLTADLQMMTYTVALEKNLYARDAICKKAGGDYPIKGVRYNVIKRPGQYQGKKETRAEFEVRLAKIIREKPDEFFARWKVELTSADIKRFQRDILDPVLMQLSLWYDVVVAKKKVKIEEVPPELVTFTFPYGVFNVLTEGGIGELDNYILTGDERGLRRVDNLFPELV